jgi:hypothetical protein
MKNILLTALILTAAPAAMAFTGSYDCLGTVKQALLPGQKTALVLKGGKTAQGLACEFEANYIEATSGVTHEVYRGLSFTHSAQIAYPDGKVSELAPYATDRLEDNSNGLDQYTITQCAVTNQGLALQYTKKQTSGWHSKSKHSLRMTFEGGKIKSVNSCFFH